MLGLVMAAALVVVAVLIGSSASARSDRAHQRPRLSERRILEIAKTAAAQTGDPKPSLIQHSEGTRHNANLVGLDAGVPGQEWSYLIAERGRFVLKHAHTPPRAPAPRGSVLVLIVNASTGQRTDGGVTPEHLGSEYLHGADHGDVPERADRRAEGRESTQSPMASGSPLSLD